jgi:hypothetical protein
VISPIDILILTKFEDQLLVLTSNGIFAAAEPLLNAAVLRIRRILNRIRSLLYIKCLLQQQTLLKMTYKIYL